jgi:hypothetical protein
MQHLEDIMHKEMSRKEFLATVGFGMASLFGFSTALKFLFGKGQAAHGRVSTMGYGSSAYGGK